MVKPEHVDKALEEIRKRPANHEYFFNKLTSPAWIKPLFQKGMFQKPPKPIQDGDYVSFPFWPESSFLVRMAKLAPQKVLDVTLQIPKTDNFRVNDDIMSIALSLPPDFAIKIISKAKECIKSPYTSQVAIKVGQLMANLAQGGHIEAALDLARSLLAVLPDPRVSKKEYEERLISPEPTAKFDIWDYKEILEKHIPALVNVGGERTFNMLCDLLEYTLLHSGSERPHDYSYIWRSAIEEQEQNMGSNILKDVLVTSVRDTAEQIIKKDSSELPNLIKHLEKRKWWIFNRIALHILRVFAEVAPDLIEKYLTERKLFDSPAIRHEYALLMRDEFGILSPASKNTILDWIAKGPDINEFNEGEFSFTGKYPTDEEVVTRVKYWKRDRLTIIGSSLPDYWQKKFKKLENELGPSRDPFFTYKTSVSWVGPTSPKTADEMKSMTVGEMIDFLRTWDPTGKQMSPSPLGLGRILTEVIADVPDKYSKHAPDFQGLNSVYIVSIVRVWYDSIGKKLFFSWSHVLDLCLWAVRQTREIPKDKVISEFNLDWSNSWKEIARLLSAGFQKGPAEIPKELRKKAWEVLVPITNDPDPTPEYESRYGGSNMNLLTMSINTTRGEAMHTVVHYALWVKRNLDKKSDQVKSFNNMPEVREALEQHLVPSNDPALSLRAVYGQWLPWLFYLDSEWAEKNLTKIFPAEDKLQNFRDTAWDAYIVRCNPYDNVLKPLNGEYKHAIEKIGSVSSEKYSFCIPNNRLAEHLMVFYLRGKISLADPEGLLTLFYRIAPDNLRGHAIDFIGRSFFNKKDDIEPEIIERAKKLWEQRLETALSATTTDQFYDELSHFGWWFSSKKFNDSWAIEQAKKILKAVKKIDPSSMVAERLAELAVKMPLQTVECLGLLIGGEKKAGGIYVFKESARSILETALCSSDPKARRTAEDVVHILGSYGFLDFRSLISKK